MKHKLLSFVFVVGAIVSVTTFGYRMETGELYGGAGFGLNVNVARMEKPNLTPGAELPLWASVDYLVDQDWGVFGSVIPSFSVGNMGLSFRAGAKYWLTRFDFPFYPYVSLAVAPGFLLPFKGPNHFNLGISPGVGAVYFIVAKFTVGAHIHFNPSMAFAGGERRFEFSVMPFFDLGIRL